MNTKTKLTALLISILMVVAMIPAFALTATAAEPGTNDVVAVYGIDGELKRGYASLEEAWVDFQTGDEWKLLANCSTFNSTAHNRGLNVGNGQTLTIDLNGFALTPPTVANDGVTEGVFRLFYISSGGELTIKDSNPTAEHYYYESPETAGLYVLDDEKDDGKVEASEYFMIPGGVITGGVGDKGTGTSWINDTSGAIMLQAGYLKIEGGNFIGNQSKTKGGVIYIDQLNHVAPCLIITNALFVGNVSASNEDKNIGGCWLNFVNDPNSWYIAGESSISGGVFSDNLPGLNAATPDGWYLAPGYGFVQDETTGWYTVGLVTEPVEVDGVTHYMLQIEAGISATCDVPGLTGKRKCTGACSVGSSCTYTDGGMVIPAKGHTEVTDEAIAPTCTMAGKTEGKHCQLCGKITVVQTKMNPLGHTPGEWTIGQAATETEKGIDYKYCSVCGDAVERRESLPLNERTEAPTTPATPATEENTTDTNSNENEGCKSVVGSAAGMILVALLGGCAILRKKED